MSRESIAWQWRRQMRALTSRFKQDRRGGTAVQALVMMPVFVIPIVVFFFAWQTMSVKRTFHTATYEAVRYLALYPPDDDRRWQPVATQIIRQSMSGNQFVDRLDLLGAGRMPRGLYVEVIFLDGDFACGSQFEVRASFEHDIPTAAPPFNAFPTGIFELTETRVGEVLCK